MKGSDERTDLRTSCFDFEGKGAEEGACDDVVQIAERMVVSTPRLLHQFREHREQVAV